MSSTNRLSARDIEEFNTYLNNCTSAQVRNVLEKERKANRTAYAQLEKDEAIRRGLNVR